MLRKFKTKKLAASPNFREGSGPTDSLFEPFDLIVEKNDT